MSALKERQPFLLSMTVTWCLASGARRMPGVSAAEAIRYGIAVTIEASTPIPVYDEIQERLRIRPQV